MKNEDSSLDPSPPIATSGKVVACDPGIYEEISAPWELIATPVGSGAFFYQKTYLATPSFIAYQESFATAVRVRGLTPAGMLGLSVPIRTGARTSYWNAPLHEGGLPSSMPGALEAVIDAGQVHIIVLIELSALRQRLPDAVVTKLVRTASRRLLSVSVSAAQALSHWLYSVLEQVEQRPEILQYPAIVCSLEEELFQHLDAIGRGLQARPARPQPSQRRLGLDRALEYLRESGVYSVTVPLLSEVAGVSQRTLEYAFRDTFGVTPLAYLRIRRLHAVRRALLSSHPDETTIADIAHRVGIYELGRFASGYKRLFGELPSHTMAQPRAEVEPWLLPPCGGYG